MKHLFALLMVGVIIFSSSSCKKEEKTTVYEAVLTGGKEVPAITSTATGTATLTLNTETNIFDLSVTFTGVTATAMHIHKGAVGVNGGVIFPISTLTSPVTYKSVALDSTQLADLAAGSYYLNIHSAANPGGEIRGNFVKK